MTFGNSKRQPPMRGGGQVPSSNNGSGPQSGAPHPFRRRGGDARGGGPSDDSHDDPHDPHNPAPGGEGAPPDRFELIRRELDVADPWKIVKVVANYVTPTDDPTRFDIYLQQTQGYWACPVCTQRLVSTGETRRRIFRDTTRVPETNIHVRIPIVHCATDGMREVHVPWTQKQDKWQYIGETDE